MWTDIPLDLLSRIFSLLSVDSLVRAASACKHWYACAKLISYSSTDTNPPWFISVPARNPVKYIFACNPLDNQWHLLLLDFIPYPVSIVASVGNHLLLKLVTISSLKLLLCNPFTKKFRLLPLLNTSRSNSTIGIVTIGPEWSPSFHIYVAGGTSDPTHGAATYVPTVEVYDSTAGKWRHTAEMPIHFAMRMAVWTPTESVFYKGVLYWVTSAKAYTVMGFELERRRWKEIQPPMAEKLVCATLVRYAGKLALVGGLCTGDCYIWELQEGDEWTVAGMVPSEIGRKFTERKGNWIGTRCVGSDQILYLFREIGSLILIWKMMEAGRWDWILIEGFKKCLKETMNDFSIKGFLLQPNLARSSLFDG